MGGGITILRTKAGDSLLPARESNDLDPAVDKQFPYDKGEYLQHQFAVGASYTSVSNITTNFEYHYNRAGLFERDAEDWFAVGSDSKNNPAALAQARGEPFGKHTLFLRSNWIDAGMDDLDLTGLLITELNDNSHLIQVETVYKPTSRMALSFRLAIFQGNEKSNYGSLRREQSVTLQFERGHRLSVRVSFLC